MVERGLLFFSGALTPRECELSRGWLRFPSSYRSVQWLPPLLSFTQGTKQYNPWNGLFLLPFSSGIQWPHTWNLCSVMTLFQENHESHKTEEGRGSSALPSRRWCPSKALMRTTDGLPEAQQNQSCAQLCTAAHKIRITDTVVPK